MNVAAVADSGVLERLNGIVLLVHGAGMLDKTYLEHLRRNGYRL